MASVKKLEKSRVEIMGSVPAQTFASYKEEALKNIAKNVKIDGFREGNVPAKVLETKVGQPVILDEMAQLAITDAYPKLLADNNVQAIGLPSIQITKVAPDNDLEFTIITAVLPEITLGDYKKIAKEAGNTTEAVEVSEEEIETAIKELRQMRAHHKMHEDGVEHHEHDHTKIPEDQLPPIDEEFVRSLGKFENLEDFKTKLKENLLQEKKNKEVEKHRIAMVDGILDATTVEMPDMLVDFELDKMMQQFIYDISMMGHTFEDYLAKIEKTEADLKQEWRVNAEKRAKMQLVLEEIAAKEKIAPSDEEVQTEIQKILDMYQDQKDISEERVRAYVVQILTNAKVFEYLEGLK